MNRSAQDGEWSSPHYGGEGDWVPLRRTKVFAGDTVGKSVSDSGRPGIVRRAGMAGIVRHSQTKGRASTIAAIIPLCTSDRATVPWWPSPRRFATQP